MHLKNNIFLLILASIFFAFVIAAGWFVFYTTQGAESALRLLLYSVTRAKNIEIEWSEGIIRDKASFHNIYIADPKKLPEGSVVQIQRI